MMKSQIAYGLQGAFKVDTYDAKGNFVETTDWFDNFITQTGLMYPYKYSFANCFRFLTLGSSPSMSSGGYNGATPTTGCYVPFRLPNTPIHVSNGTDENGSWIGYKGYEIGEGSLFTSCTTKITPEGVRFFRSWSIPTGGVGLTINNLTPPEMDYLNVNEFAVSPNSGGTDGAAAFSRVQRTLPIKNGYRAVISYQLQVNMLNENRTIFTEGTFNTANANTEYDPDLVAGWQNLSGYYRQVWCGLSCVDQYGVTFIPKYGNGMEPSLTDLSRYHFYLSPDNAAFDLNATGGGVNLSVASGYATDGLMMPIGRYPASLNMNVDRSEDFPPASEAEARELYYGPEVLQPGTPSDMTPKNIRLGSKATALVTPSLENYTLPIIYNRNKFNYQTPNDFVRASNETISYATPGQSGIDARGPDYGQRAVFSSSMYRLPMDMNLPGNHFTTGRSKKISRRASFTPASSLGRNTRFGSLVFAYLSNNDTAGEYEFYPLLDTLFFDSSGRSLMQHYRFISGIYLTDRGAGIVDARLTVSGLNFISGASNSANRFTLCRTIQGKISSNQFVDGTLAGQPNWIANHPLQVISGSMTNASGNISYSWAGGAGSGSGAIIGFSGFTGLGNGGIFMNQALANHNLFGPSNTVSGSDSVSGTLYWPYCLPGNELSVQFTEVYYYTSDGCMGGAVALKSGDAGYSWGDNPCKFREPKATILSVEAVHPLSGYRLLPHFGIANQNTLLGSNYNPPSIGGIYPALSMDNGIEIYLDITWSGGCKGADPSTCI